MRQLMNGEIELRYVPLLSYDDAYGNLTSVADPLGQITTYRYDALGRKVAETLPMGQTETWAYDDLGRLTTVTAVKLDGATLATPLATTYAYDLNNALTRTTLPNGTVEARSYDSLDRLIDVVTTGPAGQVVAGDHYTLGLNGNRWVDDQDGGRRVEYGYDALGRLIREYARVPNVGDRTTTYAYDLAGNRTQTDTITHTAGGSDGASSQLLRLRRQRPAHRRDRLRQRTSHHNHLHL